MKLARDSLGFMFRPIISMRPNHDTVVRLFRLYLLINFIEQSVLCVKELLKDERTDPTIANSFAETALSSAPLN